MKKTLLLFGTLAVLSLAVSCSGGNATASNAPVQEAVAHPEEGKVYDEQIDPLAQIDWAVKLAKDSGRHVICQVGGNWCPWCLRFADFITKDDEIAKLISDNYVYIHVNYPRQGAAEDLMARLGNPGRFGYPVMVVLKEDGSILHIQDSSFLEEGQGYDRAKVIRFFKNWTPFSL